MNRTGWQKTWVKILTSLLTLAVMLMIFCLSRENAEQSDLRSGFIALSLVRILHSDYENMTPDQQKAFFDIAQLIVRKCAHFSEYALLGFMLRLCLESWLGSGRITGTQITAIGFVSGVLYACTDEAHQLAVDGRNGTLTDVLVDGTGVLAGLFFGCIFIRLINRRYENIRSGDHDGVFQTKQSQSG